MLSFAALGGQPRDTRTLRYRKAAAQHAANRSKFDVFIMFSPTASQSAIRSFQTPHRTQVLDKCHTRPAHEPTSCGVRPQRTEVAARYAGLSARRSETSSKRKYMCIWRGSQAHQI